MTAWLFLIDDAQECRTQRAVLAAFADALGERHGATVCLTSCMGATHPWPEVPVQAARRLAAAADVVIENFRPGTLERWECAAFADWLRQSLA